MLNGQIDQVGSRRDSRSVEARVVQSYYLPTLETEMDLSRDEAALIAAVRDTGADAGGMAWRVRRDAALRTLDEEDVDPTPEEQDVERTAGALATWRP